MNKAQGRRDLYQDIKSWPREGQALARENEKMATEENVEEWKTNRAPAVLLDKGRHSRRSTNRKGSNQRNVKGGKAKRNRVSRDRY